jgi:hypothetical protein
MKPWLRIVLWSLVFWAIWVGIAGLTMTVHGDCGIGATGAEAAACVREKGRVGLAVLAIGAPAYALMLWLMVRRPRGRDS